MTSPSNPVDDPIGTVRRSTVNGKVFVKSDDYGLPVWNRVLGADSRSYHEKCSSEALPDSVVIGVVPGTPAANLASSPSELMYRIRDEIVTHWVGRPCKEISAPSVAGYLAKQAMEVVTPELERRDALYEAAEQQYAEVTGDLRTDRDRYKAAHESTQRGLIRMEVQRDEACTEVEAIRGALREVGEDAVPPNVTTLAAVQWLIGEHQTLSAQNEELGAESSVLANERDTLAWLHAEAAWQRNENAKLWATTQGEVEVLQAHWREARMQRDVRGKKVRELAEENAQLIQNLNEQRGKLSRAVLVWPQNAMVRIRECIADPSRMGPRQHEPYETVAGWGARAVVKLLETWRASAAPEPCVCNGGWTVDENYQPEDYERNDPPRPEKGLIPCGFCNHGGWDAPWPPLEATPVGVSAGSSNDGAGSIGSVAAPAAASADTTPREWNGPDPGKDRALLIDVVRYVLKGRHPGQSTIQRNVRVSFAKAGQLLDLMESWGLVGPKHGSLAREILAPAEAVEDVVAAIANTGQEAER